MFPKVCLQVDSKDSLLQRPHLLVVELYNPGYLSKYLFTKIVGEGMGELFLLWWEHLSGRNNTSLSLKKGYKEGMTQQSINWYIIEKNKGSIYIIDNIQVICGFG